MAAFCTDAKQRQDVGVPNIRHCCSGGLVKPSPAMGRPAVASHSHLPAIQRLLEIRWCGSQQPRKGAVAGSNSVQAIGGLIEAIGGRQKILIPATDISMRVCSSTSPSEGYIAATDV